MAGAGAAEEGEVEGAGGAGGGQDGCECAVYGEEVTGCGEEMTGEGDVGIGWMAVVLLCWGERDGVEAGDGERRCNHRVL